MTAQSSSLQLTPPTVPESWCPSGGKRDFAVAIMDLLAQATVLSGAGGAELVTSTAWNELVARVAELEASAGVKYFDLNIVYTAANAEYTATFPSEIPSGYFVDGYVYDTGAGALTTWWVVEKNTTSLKVRINSASAGVLYLRVVL